MVGLCGEDSHSLTELQLARAVYGQLSGFWLEENRSLSEKKMHKFTRIDSEARLLCFRTRWEPSVHWIRLPYSVDHHHQLLVTSSTINYK